MWFDAANPDRIILGNDGGVSTTMDGSAKWNNFLIKSLLHNFIRLPTICNRRSMYLVLYKMKALLAEASIIHLASRRIPLSAAGIMHPVVRNTDTGGSAGS